MYLLFDAGASKIRLAVSADGQSFGDTRIIPTPATADAIAGAIFKIGTELAGGQPWRAVIGGLSRKLSAIEGALTTSSLSCPVYLYNDTALVGLGEAVAGAGQGKKIVMYSTVSSGVGGVRIVDGVIDRAAVGGAAGGIKKDWGAIRMSLDDNRLDVPFGLVLTLFQSAKRIRATSQASEFNGAVQGTNQDDFTFRAMACLFFEMVKLEDYSFDLNANQELITEYARFFYTGLVNVKTTLQSTNVASQRTATEG